MDEQPPRTQEFTVNGDEVVAKVKELIHKGQHPADHHQQPGRPDAARSPLTIGLIGAEFLPVLAAIGAAAAIATRFTLVVVRDVEATTGTASLSAEE